MHKYLILSIQLEYNINREEYILILIFCMILFYEVYLLYKINAYFFLIEFDRRKMEPLPFQQFQGKYTIVQELGRGASGICYHIVTKVDREHFVLKKILLNLMEPKKVNNQIKILSTLSHPNLIKLRQSYVSKEYLYLQFDYDYQKDMQKLIKQRQKDRKYFPQSLIWLYLRKMLQALQYLHQKGIIHRDVKPSNIFVNPHNNDLLIGDLGTAKFCQPQNYSRIGTPLYLPPEIIKYQSYCQKIDIWSLGVTIFQIATLKLPFQNHNFLKLAQMISYQQPNYPSHLSENLLKCIKSMLMKDPKERPSCRQLLEAYFSKQQNNLQLQQKIQDIRSVHFKEEQKEEDQQQWNVLLVTYHTIKSVKQDIKISNRIITDQSQKQPKLLKMCSANSIKSIVKKHSNSIHSKQDGIIQQNNLKDLQMDEDDTIILQVNPNDFNNFCGYYRDSRRTSRANLQSIQNSKKFLRAGRKSSLFKKTEPNQPQVHSHFKSNSPFMNKQNYQSKLTFHKRQQSGISHKYKHGQLMSGLRPSKHQKETELSVSPTQINKPQLVIIDLKPLLNLIDKI